MIGECVDISAVLLERANDGVSRCDDLSGLVGCQQANKLAQSDGGEVGHDTLTPDHLLLGDDL
jgi:hypothetical protein